MCVLLQRGKSREKRLQLKLHPVAAGSSDPSLAAASASSAPAFPVPKGPATASAVAVAVAIDPASAAKLHNGCFQQGGDHIQINVQALQAKITKLKTAHFGSWLPADRSQARVATGRPPAAPRTAE